MNKYDFKALSPFEFELLIQDLMQKKLDITLESFKSGKDKGIDLRYCVDDKETLIIQCKRYTGNFDVLYAALKREVKKVKKLKPKQYILAVSTELSRDNKKKICELFEGNIKRQKDILGCEDINTLLSDYPEIEKKHFKLWLSSINIMEKILHNNIQNRSSAKIEEIKNKVCKYVPNKSFNKAEAILDKHNYAIILGNPGIGKTTLAEFLIWQYLSKDFELVEISNDIEEAWTLLKPDSEKQVFYYDDFLGKTNLIKSLNKNEDKRLVQFIEKVQKSNNKKFLLTTREYILQEAKLEYEHIDTFPLMKCIIPLEDYTFSIRSKILYNHLYFSDIPEEYINQLLEENKFLNIINHKNYNPRIIDYYTNLNRVSKIQTTQFYETFMNALDNPSDIWEHIYNKLDDASKSILLALLTLSFYGSELNELYQYADKFYYNLSKDNLSKSQFKNTLKVLEGNFIGINKKRYLEKEHHVITLINPSLQDFLENNIFLDNEQALILNSIQSLSQFKYVFNTFLKNKRSYDLIDLFIKKLIEKISFEISEDLVKKVTLIIEAVKVSGDLSLFELLEPSFKHICKVEILTDGTEMLFSELQYIDLDESNVVKNFIYEYKSTIIENIEFFGKYYTDIESFARIKNFYKMFEEIFNTNEKEAIKNEFIQNYGAIADSIENESYGYSFEFRSKTRDYEDIIEFLEIEDDIILDTHAYLEEKLKEIESEEEEESYKSSRIENALSKAEKKSLIEKSEEMTDEEVISMFDNLRY